MLRAKQKIKVKTNKRNLVDTSTRGYDSSTISKRIACNNGDTYTEYKPQRFKKKN